MLNTDSLVVRCEHCDEALEYTAEMDNGVLKISVKPCLDYAAAVYEVQHDDGYIAGFRVGYKEEWYRQVAEALKRVDSEETE